MEKRLYDQGEIRMRISPVVMRYPFHPQPGRPPPRRLRHRRLRVTMVMTVGTGDAVMLIQPFEIGPVNVVSYSLWHPQPQAQPDPVTSSSSYWPGSSWVMTSGSSISVQLPARRVKVSPQG